MKALQLTAHGNADDVVRLVDLPEPGDPGPGEVLIDVEASPVEPTDLYTIAGVYGYQPPLPHLLGAQGVGRVIAVGPDVTHLAVGDRALVPPLGNAWASRVRTSAAPPGTRRSHWPWMASAATRPNVSWTRSLGMSSTRRTSCTHRTASGSLRPARSGTTC